MDIATLTAESRSDIGSRASRNLRKTGKLPGIIYGHGETPEAFAVSTHDFLLQLHHGARILGLDINGKKNQYLIKEVQYDHLDKEPIHIDLARVDMNERVEVGVTIELRGTPEGLADGGVIEQLMDEIRVECLASNIPDVLHPSVVHLGIDDDLLVKDLELPDGITVLSDPNEKIAIVRIPTEKAADEEEVEEGAESAEPERIGRVADDEKQSDDPSK